jgi:hypothetical protein
MHCDSIFATYRRRPLATTVAAPPPPVYAAAMTRVSIGCLVIVAVALSAHADETRPGKGFWKILVKPKARWVLHDTIPEDTARKPGSITVETYDVRKVGGADVARLRWTHSSGTQNNEIGGGPFMPTQVAVTSAGVYLLSDDMDDAKISAALKNKPSRSDPPKPYSGTKRNRGRYLRVDRGNVCMGEAGLPDDGPCADVCESEVCFSATDGVVSISGLAAPGYSIWSQ